MNTLHLPSLCLCSLALLAFSACDDTSYQDDPPVQETVDDNNTTSPDEVTEPDVRTSPLTWCQPNAVPYDTSAIPQLPDRVVLEGFCDATVPTIPEGVEPGSAAGKVLTLDRATNSLEIAQNESFSGLSGSATFTFDDQGLVRHVFATGTEGYYTSEFGSSWYDLDEQGEMTHKVAAKMPWMDAPEEEWEVLVKEQSWNGDKLLSRTEYDGQDGPVLREWVWTWSDSGQLLNAKLTDHSQDELQVHEARWSYHPEGEPAKVERLINDILIQRESWDYHASTRQLAARTYWATSFRPLAAVHGGTQQSWTVTMGLDDQQITNNNYSEDPWARALPSKQEGCTQLPSGVGHGYPDAEVAYQLGVSRDMRPQGIGFSYGNDSYGWSYGNTAWYGHDGMGTSWLGNGSGEVMDVVEIALTYNTQGQMIQEVATIEIQGSEFSLERTRTFEDKTLMVSDALMVHIGDEVQERTLRFTYNDQKGLVERSLFASEELLATQTWERDAQGRVLRHALPFTTTNQESLLFPEATAIFGSFSSFTVTDNVWEWSYEGDHLVSRSGGEQDLLQTMNYDDQGRLIEVQGVFLDTDYSTREEWQFDNEGRVMNHCQHQGDNVNCVQTAYDSAGRIAWKLRNTNVSEQAPFLVEHNSYVCQ